MCKNPGRWGKVVAGPETLPKRDDTNSARHEPGANNYSAMRKSSHTTTMFSRWGVPDVHSQMGSDVTSVSLANRFPHEGAENTTYNMYSLQPSEAPRSWENRAHSVHFQHTHTHTRRSFPTRTVQVLGASRLRKMWRPMCASAGECCTTQLPAQTRTTLGIPRAAL